MSKGTDKTMSRREIVAGGSMAAVGSAAFLAGTGLAGSAEAQPQFGQVSAPTYSESSARQEIEYLRKWYAVATDILLQENQTSGFSPLSIDGESLGPLNHVEDAFNIGRKIYRRVFSPDAEIHIAGVNPPPPGATPLRVGPDEWATFVHGITFIKATQHLIGTQLTDIDVMPSVHPSMSSTATGHGKMSSYLQAFHELADGNSTSVFLGVYFDDVEVRTLRDGTRGWQIVHMNLLRVTGGSWATTIPPQGSGLGPAGEAITHV
jgi:hypothetical protein